VVPVVQVVREAAKSREVPPRSRTRSASHTLVYAREMTGTHPNNDDKRKQSLYFPEKMLGEIASEARRLDRSMSWVVQRAWKVAREEMKKMLSTNV
jgi:uncharacterized small protein (TIGR04563 family)